MHVSIPIFKHPTTNELTFNHLIFEQKTDGSDLIVPCATPVNERLDFVSYFLFGEGPRTAVVPGKVRMKIDNPLYS